jgi:hypothetical protein
MSSRLFLALGCIVVLFAAVARADGPPVGKITEVTGTVWLLPAGAADKDRKAVKVNQEVREGDTIVTDAGSTARVDFKDGSEMKVGEKSKCAIRKKSTTLSKPTKLHLFTGKMRVKVKVERVSRGLFEISTPTSVAGVRGSDILTLHKNITTYVVFGGRLSVRNIMDEVGKTVTVPAKHMTEVGGRGAPSHPLKLDKETLNKFDRDMSLAEKKKGRGDTAVAGRKKKEEKRGEEKKEGTVAEGEPAEGELTTGDDGGPADTGEPEDVVSGEAMEEMTGDTSAEVLTEEGQELVQEEVQEVSAERLPEPPGPPTE